MIKNGHNMINNDKDPTFFENLGKPQTPKFLYFGCSDSRVPANEILGKG